MGLFDDMLLAGGGLAFAEHEHHKYQMQRQVLNSQLQPQQPQYGNQGHSQSYGQQRGMGPSYDQYQQPFNSPDQVTISRSEYERLQRDATEGRQMMNRYVEKMEALDQERRQLRVSSS